MQTKRIQEGEKVPPSFLQWKDQNRYRESIILWIDRINIHLDIVNRYDSKAELKPLIRKMSAHFFRLDGTNQRIVAVSWFLY